MADCKCFINDQLLPVRAGCEATYCKDVNSSTAIRNEALSRLADLQRQLQQAQERAEAAEETVGRYNDQWKAVVRGLEEQRDEAIERGKLIWKEYLAQVAFGRVLIAVRAKAAEALAQRGEGDA